MSILDNNFHDIFVEEGHPFYGNIYSLDKFEFNNWVKENFIEKATIESFDIVQPSKEMLEKLFQKGYVHISNQCHYQAKAVNIIDKEFEYWTGFVNRQDPYFPIITHSFNIYHGKIVDFSRINDDFTIVDEADAYFPNVYYGINIPSEFVLKFKDETFNDSSMNPLLYEWFVETNNL